MNFKIGETVEVFNGQTLVRSGRITRIITEMLPGTGRPGRSFICVDGVVVAPGLQVFCPATGESYATGVNQVRRAIAELLYNKGWNNGDKR